MLITKPPEHPPIFAAFDVRRIENPVVGSEGRPQEFVVTARVGVIERVRGISQEKASYWLETSIRCPGLEGAAPSYALRIVRVEVRIPTFVNGSQRVQPLRRQIVFPPFS